MEFGIQAITRLETGAAMPPQEVENTRERFMPLPLDSKEVAKIKLEMYEETIQGTINLVDPTGSLDENGAPAPGLDVDAFDAELERRTGVSQGEKVGRFKVKVK